MRIFNCCLYLFIISIFTSCNTLEKDRRVIIVYIDYSASSSSDLLEKYIKIINNDIFANLKKEDCLIVMPIDEGAKREPVKLVYEDMLTKKFTSKSDGFAHAQDSINFRMQQYVSKIAPQIKEVLNTERIRRKRYTNYTDIVGALQQSDSFFDKKTADSSILAKTWDFIIGKSRYKTQNVIVLLSDMIQDSWETSFDNRRGISSSKSRLYVQGLSEQGRMPDLTSCKIFVIGATGKTSTQIDNIKTFWERYFEKSKGSLECYGYDVSEKLNQFMIVTN